jgi:O-antigen ligase
MAEPAVWRTRLLAAAIGALLPLSVFVPLATTVLLALAALTAFRPWPRPPAGRWRLPLLAALALIALGLASAIWAISPAFALEAALKTLALLLAGAVLAQRLAGLDEAGRRLVEGALLTGFALGLALLLVEAATDQALARLIARAQERPFDPRAGNRGAVMLTLTLAPVVVLLWRRGLRHAALAALVLAPVAVLGLHSHSAILALTLGLAVFALVLAFGRPAALVLASVAALALLASPLIYRTLLGVPDEDGLLLALSLRESAYHRLYIWQFAAERVMEQPLLGHGLRHYRLLPKPFELARELGGPYPPETAHWFIDATHPHSVFLQVWVDLGAAGALALATLLVTLVAASARPGGARPEAAARVAGLVAYLAVGLTAYDMVQTQWMATAWLLVAVTALMREPPAGAAGAPEGGVTPPERLCTDRARDLRAPAVVERLPEGRGDRPGEPSCRPPATVES